jgi:predicted glycoside hydrolase/deacetylase ChbG (UPF0249 family)
VPSLVGPDGCFFSGGELLGALNRFQRRDVEREVRAQFDRFVDLAGRAPDHLDSHQFVGCLHPDVFAVLVEMAVSARVPLRDPGDFLERGRLERFLRRVRTENGGEGPAFRDFVDLPDTLSALRRRLQPFRSPDAFRYEFYGSGARHEVFLDVLASLPDGVTEVMCHPGHADGLEDGYRLPRERELAILRAPGLREEIRGRGAHLVSFAVLGVA